MQKRFIMDKERFDWVVSGLNRYNLTKKEDQFVKSIEDDFNKKIRLLNNRKKN
jgi:hypothetical protein